VWDDIDRLLGYLGRDVPTEVRVLKLAEETGEAAQALIGLNGWNPRKGVYATKDDLLDELADVMLTAAVAMTGVTQDAGLAGEIFTRRLATVVARAGLDGPASNGSLVMVTTNAAKAATATEHLAPFGITVEHVAMELDEIQSAAVSEVAVHKARQAYARLRRPVIVEDGGFFIDELGGFPGALAKLATSMLGVQGLIGLAGQTLTRAAHFESTVAYADGRTERTFSNVGPSGTVADRPAARTREGAWSVLWDIWIPPGRDQPLSAFSDEEFSTYLAEWRARSVFTELGDWLRMRLESGDGSTVHLCDRIHTVIGYGPNIRFAYYAGQRY